jgi:hypothetical protein
MPLGEPSFPQMNGKINLGLRATVEALHRIG